MYQWFKLQHIACKSVKHKLLLSHDFTNGMTLMRYLCSNLKATLTQWNNYLLSECLKMCTFFKPRFWGHSCCADFRQFFYFIYIVSICNNNKSYNVARLAINIDSSKKIFSSLCKTSSISLVWRWNYYFFVAFCWH